MKKPHFNFVHYCFRTLLLSCFLLLLACQKAVWVEEKETPAFSASFPAKVTESHKSQSLKLADHDFTYWMSSKGEQSFNVAFTSLAHLNEQEQQQEAEFLIKKTYLKNNQPIEDPSLPKVGELSERWEKVMGRDFVIRQQVELIEGYLLLIYTTGPIDEKNSHLASEFFNKIKNKHNYK